MKLNRFATLAFPASLLVGLVGVLGLTGCGGGTPARAPQTALPDPSTTATTQLMSAEVPGPAPKVGKAELADDDAVKAGATLEAQKQPRPSDGSRRGGGFGSTK